MARLSNQRASAYGFKSGGQAAEAGLRVSDQLVKVKATPTAGVQKWALTLEGSCPVHVPTTRAFCLALLLSYAAHRILSRGALGSAA